MGFRCARFIYLFFCHTFYSGKYLKSFIKFTVFSTNFIFIKRTSFFTFIANKLILISKFSNNVNFEFCFNRIKTVLVESNVWPILTIRFAKMYWQFWEVSLCKCPIAYLCSKWRHFSFIWYMQFTSEYFPRRIIKIIFRSV